MYKVFQPVSQVYPYKILQLLIHGKEYQFTKDSILEEMNNGSSHSEISGVLISENWGSSRFSETDFTRYFYFPLFAIINLKSKVIELSIQTLEISYALNTN